MKSNQIIELKIWNGVQRNTTIYMELKMKGEQRLVLIMELLLVQKKEKIIIKIRLKNVILELKIQKNIKNNQENIKEIIEVD